MSGVAEAITLAASLTQLAIQATTAATELSALVHKAQAEGRDLTDAELDQARQSALAARNRLTQG